MRLRFYFILWCLSLLTMTEVQAENVTFLTYSWDNTNKQVVSTPTTHDCTPIEGQDWSWMALGEKDAETWYVVKGTDVTRKVLVIFGTVHLVLLSDSKLTCNHVKLEAQNNAVLHVHCQDNPVSGMLNVTNYSPDGKREYKDAAAIGSGGDEGNNSGSLYVHGGNIVAEQVKGNETAFSNGSYGAAIGGGKKGSIDPNHRVVVYAGSVTAKGSHDGAGIGGGYKAHQGGPVIIYGGDVEATSAFGGAAIGGGDDGNGGRVEIYGGTVTATAHKYGYAAAIGGGDAANGGDVHIYGGKVNAYGSKLGAGIGGSKSGNGGNLEIAGGTVYAKTAGTSSTAGYEGSPLGAGRDGTGCTVTIKGGTVTLEKGAASSNKAFLIGGHNYHKQATLEIAPGMKVTYHVHNGQNTIATADKRVEELLKRVANVYGKIEPCDHQGTGATYKQIDNQKHSVVCKACAYEGEEEHSYTDGKCVCGKEENKTPESYTITIHTTIDGIAYAAGKEQTVAQSKEFTLPVPQPLNGLIFKGYLKAELVDGIEMKDTEEDALIEGGTTMTPDADAHYFARYRYAYDEEWTWNAECTEASVKVTNTLRNDSRTLNATITPDESREPVAPTETTLGESYFTATASFTDTEGVTYQFIGQATLMYQPDTKPVITLSAPSAKETNTEILVSYLGMEADVTINNLTLRKDNKVHPICLPFNVSTTAETPLKGAIIYELSGIQQNNHEYTMTFKHATGGLTAGVPSFYRFASGTDVQNPVFSNVLIEECNGLIAEKEDDPTTWSADDETLELWGTFEPEAIDEVNRELYFLMDEDISLMPASLSAFGSYFYIATPTDEQGNSTVRRVRLNFEEDAAYCFTEKLAYSWDGDGSKTNPYIISSAEQLNEMQEEMNGTDAAALEGKYFRQGANIAFDKDIPNNYTPVSNFNGHYDGDGYVISGLNISTDANAALFLNVADGSTIKNIILKNSTLTGSTAGSIAYRLNGTANIENCHVLKDVTVTSNNSYAGGIVAYIPPSGTPTIKDCSSHATVTAHQSYAGGIVASVVGGTVDNCVYLGNSITANSSSRAYAVAGNNGGTVTNCYFTHPDLTDANAALMPRSTADNTNFLTLLKTRDEFMKVGKTELVVSDYNYDITLNGHTLYKDDTWNTLCLPFDVEDITGTSLAGATVKQLTNANYLSDSNTLELIFNTPNHATRINSGETYFLKWENNTNVENPTFTGVTISNTIGLSPSFGLGDVCGTLKPVILEANDKTKLFLGANNKLYYPNADVTINSFHAYIQLGDDYVAGDPNIGSGVRSIVLNFGDGETTSIETLKNGKMDGLKLDGTWYDLSGRKVANGQSKRGVYIVDGKKVVIK